MRLSKAYWKLVKCIEKFTKILEAFQCSHASNGHSLLARFSVRKTHITQNCDLLCTDGPSRIMRGMTTTES